MISYIKGPLMEKDEDLIVVEAGNVGFNIYVPGSLSEHLPPIGEEVKVYTYLSVKEDAMTLYGFASRQDLLMFKQLLGVTGIGPKGALGIMSAITPDDLRMAIFTGDAKAIAKAPGVGIKTAQRVILDLKDKITAEDVLYSSEDGGDSYPDKLRSGALNDAQSEAVDALMALGYSAAESAKAVRQAGAEEDTDAEAILRASLKYLAF